MLELPSLDAALEFLGARGEPSVDLRLALLRDPDADVAGLRDRVGRSSAVVDALEKQRPDGSWGAKDRAGNRLLPTLWMVKTLGELGLDRSHPGWRKAVDFLVTAGHTDDEVFSIWGSRDGVLSCYVGLAALIYANGGLPELAQPQIDWIIRYQEIKVGGRDRRRESVEEWGPHLRTKYGGCMAETTCLVGLLREGRALAMWNQPDGRPLVDAIREAFLERRVMYTSSGQYVPLAVSSKNADSWLSPTYPLDWRVDLIEVIDFLGRSGPSDRRMQAAIDYIVALRLDDGSWPLRRRYQPEGLPKLEPMSKRKGSAFITMRVVEAFAALGVEV